ncbi:hypothetical protein ERO13_A04G109480v2 [Gossypium hirsutum]|nr:hypothetical protein ERO13_A04G109480v2 [Gossypium hirsutum]
MLLALRCQCPLHICLLHERMKDPSSIAGEV